MKKLILAVFLLAQMIGCAQPEQLETKVDLAGQLKRVSDANELYRKNSVKCAEGVGYLYGQALTLYGFTVAAGTDRGDACRLLGRADVLATMVGSTEGGACFDMDYINSEDGMAEFRSHCKKMAHR